MSVESDILPKKYHDAVLKWQKSNLPDLPLLEQHWEKYFPKDRPYKLCAFRDDCLCTKIEHGDHAGKEKYQKACEMSPDQATHLLKAVKAQASTEFGSIQQHRVTLARAQEEQDQFWILRMMAEELRHGYQMLYLLLNDDWKSVVGQTGEEMVEEILSMKPGTHVLGAFNIDFDSFVDNICFCNLIDRVGKYQLTMQKVSAYRPMAESMGPMLREEAFHLAAGVVPMRRWMQQAARGEVYITVDAMQRSINKWLPRGLEMFGDERGGASNVRMGFKDRTNHEAAKQYHEEVVKMIADLNVRYLRERFPNDDVDSIDAKLAQLLDGKTVDGLTREDMLHAPDEKFFRRRGIFAFQMFDTLGRPVADFDTYQRHLVATLPQAYLASSDFSNYLKLLKQVVDKEITSDEAQMRAPRLSRVGGSCPCSNAVRWIEPEVSAV